MHKLFTILITCCLLSLFSLFNGCSTVKEDPDIRPPLMNTNSFTNFVPINIITNVCLINQEQEKEN